MRLTQLFKFIMTTMLLLLSSLSVIATAKSLSSDPLVGKWKAIEPRTGQARGVIEIKYNKKSQSFYGVAKKSLTKGKTLKDLCTACPGKMKNKPYGSIPMLWNIKKSSKKNRYTDGYIMDPKDGKVYAATIKLKSNGKSMYMRGSPLGAKFIGKTVVWVRDK